MSLKCAFVVSEDDSTGEAAHVCNARAVKLVLVSQDEDDMPVCQEHYADLLPDVTLVANLGPSY